MLQAPIQSDGFVTSFTLQQKEDISQFLDKFGFVVIENILTDEQVDNTLDEFYELLQGGKDACDEELDAFYSRQKFQQFGIIGNKPDIYSISQLENRQNPNLYEAFCILFKCTKLMVGHDRLGMMRPTMRTENKSEWRTKDRWLHLDCYPLLGKASINDFELENIKPIDFEKTPILQGLLTLTDAKEIDGGFHCVPGSHKLSVEWAKKNLQNIQMQVEKDDLFMQHIQKIPIKKGCLLAWNSLLFHGNHPNFSKNWRGVQYVRMLPINEDIPYSPLYPDIKYYPPIFKMTELGKHLFGIVDLCREFQS